VTQSTSVNVIQVPRPGIVISAPAGHPGIATAITIQITVPPGLGIKQVHIDFGDKTSQDLGGSTGSITVPHTYATGGLIYIITVTVTDTLDQNTQGTGFVSIATT
jgi:hypothetical protein